jgi:hypothetical protein
MLTEAYKIAAKGDGSGLENYFAFKRPLDQALHWAEKIGHTIPQERIDGLKPVYRAAYLHKIEIQLPSIIDAIRNDAYAFSAHSDDDDLWPEIPEEFWKLYESLPHITLPDDLAIKQDILRILDLYRNMRAETVKGLETVIKETEELATEERGKIHEIDLRIQHFCFEQAVLLPEQVGEARETPLRDI